MQTVIDPLKKAINVYGRPHLAKATQVSLVMVSRWRKIGVPPKHCKTIEEATKGLVKAHELRPDIFSQPISPISCTCCTRGTANHQKQGM